MNKNLTLFSANKKINILFLPGWNTKLNMYSKLIEDLTKFGNVGYYSFEGFEKPISHPFTYEDYEYNLVNTLKEENFAPDIIIGYSFGGKVALKSVMLFKDVKLLLIAPSSFDHNILYKSKIKFKILLNKMLKKLKIKTSFLYSNDFKNADLNMKKTLINVKDVFLTKSELKKIKNQIIIIGYKKDKSVNLFDIKKNIKLLENAELFYIDGNHYKLFYDFESIEVLLERLIKND